MVVSLTFNIVFCTYLRHCVIPRSSEQCKIIFFFYRGILFVFLFPIAQNLCFLFAVGPDIHDVKLGIINDETLTTSCSDYLINQTAIPHSINSCHFHNLSCRFLDYLDIPMINKVKYQSLPVAIDAVKHGDVVGALHMAQNFSLSLEERIRLGRSVTEDVINFSEIKVWMDMSSKYKVFNKVIVYNNFLHQIS